MAISADLESVPLHIVAGRAEIDLPAAQRAVADRLTALGRDPHSAHLADTPRRVAHAYAEMLTPREFELTTFPNAEGYDELVLAKDIPVIPLLSVCSVAVSWPVWVPP